MAKKISEKPLGDRLFDMLSSIKLSIFVLAGLALTSIFGTVIQQGKERSVYVQEYGESVANIILQLNLTDMYHSWWFNVLLGLLLINITFCSIKRLPKAIRVMKDSDPVFDGKPVAIHERWEWSGKNITAEEALKRGEELLSKGHGKTHKGEADGKSYLMASSGGWSRMGVYLTHFSLFLFAIGALVGLWTGFKGYVNIVEGSSVTQVGLRPSGTHDLGFEVRCENFEVTYYKDQQGRQTGRPQDYISWLTVIEDGKEVVSNRLVEVNDPLIYKGVYFYQSSYGPAGAKGAWVTVLNPVGAIIVNKRYVRKNETITLSGGKSLLLGDATGNYQDMGPTARFILRDNGTSAGAQNVFVDPRGNNRKMGGYTVRLNEVDSIMYTGLQVAKDPGVPIVWAGCTLITIGLIISFFFSHKRIWLRVTEEGGKTSVKIVGNASRNRVSFETKFEELCEQAQETFEN